MSYRTIVVGTDSECGLEAAMLTIQPILDSLVISDS